ncbi:hypothetical protein M408DRAFT_21032 [Serendipita vermifera MAFF 305830]|uniref:Uncharacterized protein n=1 Tax=Serendipita vermifera MAFF 305830 TaxID=933852 RepID=A0A0C2X0K6_SERVB|nr:hypothetical protein M408DRAFT_21032 [Serendipita vermifera MAFF 305830]
MRSFSELSKSLGRSSSVRKSDRPSILPEKQPETTETDAKEPTKDTLAVPTSDANKPAAHSADDLFSTFDFGGLNRPPSQDISRPFDNIPPPRLSDAKSGSKRKNRQSVVPILPPTVDTLGDSLTPFGEAFKSFVQEPQPSHPNPSSSPSISVIPSLTSHTTLDDASVNTALSPPDSRNLSASGAQTVHDAEAARQSQLSPSPSNPRNKSSSSVFKSMLGIVFLKNESPSIRERRAKTETNSTTLGPSTIVTPAYEDKNASSSSLTRGLGSLRRFSRRSKEGPTSPTTPTVPVASEKNVKPAPAAVADKADEGTDVLLPPAPVVADNGRNSPVSSKYSHGVILHPVMEEDGEVPATS